MRLVAAPITNVIMLEQAGCGNSFGKISMNIKNSSPNHAKKFPKQELFPSASVQLAVKFRNMNDYFHPWSFSWCGRLRFCHLVFQHVCNTRKEESRVGKE